jgi:hypothetical protein
MLMASFTALVESPGNEAELLMFLANQEDGG